MKMQWRWLKSRRNNKEQRLAQLTNAEPEIVLDLRDSALAPSAPEETEADATPGEGVLIAAAVAKPAARQTASSPKTTARKAPAKKAPTTRKAPTTGKGSGTRSGSSSGRSATAPRAKKTTPRSK